MTSFTCPGRDAARSSCEALLRRTGTPVISCNASCDKPGSRVCGASPSPCGDAAAPRPGNGELPRTLRARIDPGLHQLSRRLLRAGHGVAAGAGGPAPGDQIVLGDVL